MRASISRKEPCLRSNCRFKCSRETKGKATNTVAIPWTPYVYRLTENYVCIDS